MLERHEREIGRFAWLMAWLGLGVGQLHALARFAVPAHAEDLDYPLTGLWARPAIDALAPLLDWGDPDLVYVTYGKIWFPVFLAFTLAATVVYRRLAPRGFSRWAWRAAIAAYVVCCAGVLLDYWTQWTGDYNALFVLGTWITFPGLFLMLLTTTVLGVTLLATGFRPLLPALLLTAQVPLALAIVQVTSLGSAALPVMFAFGLLGRRVALADRTRGPVVTRSAREVPARL